MVRYARAKGSKASNEKLPEEATPWQVMKIQMSEAKQPKVEPIRNVNDFLKKDSTNESATWAEFEETKLKTPVAHKKVKKGQLLTKAETMSQKKRRLPRGPSKNDESEGEANESRMSPRKMFKKEKIKPKSAYVEVISEVQTPPKAPKLDSTICEFEMKPIAESKFERKNPRFGNNDFGGKGWGRSRNQNQFEDHPRIKRKRESFTIKVGSKEVELRYYDGFPIRAVDWERLTKLKKKLREENIPEKQILATMKLERRRAEKSLANERKKVCFVCREPGHVLSECPSVGDAPMGQKKDSIIPESSTSGMCYKCGSREHTHYECTVVEEAAYKFAKCFVCNEQGHISKQCPDNPRGLYPKGGGCSGCGDVTHFRRDCPKKQKDKPESSVTVERLKQEDAPEALEGDSDQNTQQTPKPLKKIKKKVVKF